MTQPREVLRVDSLMNPSAGDLDIGGELHDVLQLSLGQTQALEGDDGMLKNTRAVLDFIQEIVPTLPDATRKKLSPDAAKAIIAFAGAGLAAVEKLFPNAASPATPTSPG